MAFGKSTYQSSNELRESLLDIIKDISPNEDNYFVSNMSTSAPATNTLHGWNIFHEARKSAVSTVIEGATTTYVDLPAETRSSNYTAIVSSPVRLSRTRASIANITGEDAMSVEKERALRRLKSQMEYNIVNGTVAAGATDTARGMSGIVASVTSNVTARTSGTSFTEQELNDIIQESYDQVGMGYLADVIVAPVVIKRRVASFGTNLTRNIQASEKRLTKEVRVYDTEVGQTVMVLAHKDVNKAAGTTTVLALREDLFSLAYLVGTGEPHWEERAKDGDYESGTYITEFTLVSHNEKASVKRTGYANTL